MPSVAHEVTVQTASLGLPPLKGLGLVPSEHATLMAPSLNVTLPVAPVVTTAVSATELPGLVRNAVVGLGVSVVVLGGDAPLKPRVILQDVKLIGPAAKPLSAM